MKTSRPVMLLTLIALMALMIAATPAVLAQTNPQVFASDLESGPNVGGQGNQGAWVTIYGRGFGASQGTSQVTIGGVPAYKYAIWNDRRISFQLASNTASGNIVVNVGGVSSNGIPFTVRSGRIFFVSTSGSDSRQGSYSKPWKTLTKALSTAQAGDVVYAMNGVSATSLTLSRSGSAGSPITVSAYPGATVTVGSATAANIGITGGSYSYVTLSNLTLLGTTEAVNIAGGTNWRLAGNDISCPNGTGNAACVHASSGSKIKLIANNIHDSGSTAGTNTANYASVQLSASNVEVGWNTIANTRSCRALTFYSGSTNQYGISVHDNYIHDAVCDGISVTTVDPSKGAVQVYNNIVQRAGTGPAPGGSEQAYACILTAGSGQGTVQVLNNTLYDCGARANNDSGAIAAFTPTNVSNNAVSVSSSEAYVSPNTSTANLTGSNNIFWGGASYVPAPFTNSLNADPQFVDPANADFSVQSTSPAIDAGMQAGVAKDIYGVSRPQGNASDIGALEFTGTKGSSSAGQLTENPGSLDFGSVTTGTSTTQSVTVTNSGNANATISQMNVTGAGFSATGMTLPLTLAAGQSATFTVTFAPTTAGNATGSVALISNASNSTSTVQLTGSATAAVGSLSASPTSLAFGNVTVGNTASQNVTLTASTASVTISNASVSGTGYSISGLTLPLTLTAGQSATFQIKFAPTTSGSVNGTVALTSNASNPSTSISLTGTGATAVGTLAANPTSLSFGSVTTGTSASQNVTVTASTASVTISSANTSGAGYSISGLTLPLTLTVGQSATFQVKFAPTTAGAANGSVTLTSNASNPSTSVSLSGTGTTPVGTLASNPTSLSFGSINTGTSTSQNVTITASTASVTISSANTSGAGFSMSGLTLPMTLTAGQSATFQVKFAPTTAGTANGSVTLTSNASSPTMSIAVSGTGVTPPPPSHSATLNWSASSSTGVSGYNVYRSTTSGSGYSKITPNAVSGMSLIDTSVAAGTTYYYVVTAVDSTGTESSYSSQATASVPTP